MEPVAAKTFSYSSDDLLKDPSSWTESKKQLTEFDKVLTHVWDTAMCNGLFRYTLSDCVYKRLDIQCNESDYRLPCVAQLNPQRALNRRKREAFETMNDRFDKDQFNFTKINKEEIILKVLTEQLTNAENEETPVVIPHKILINISPIEYGHVIVAPDLEKCLPQRLTRDSLLIAFDLIQLSAHPGFRLGFNSLHAWASINHLHFHAMYCDYELFGDILPADKLVKGSCCMLDDSSPLPAFVFTVPDEESGRIKIAEDITTVTEYLHSISIPYNLVINRGRLLQNDGKQTKQWTTRAILWPRKSTKNLEPSSIFDVACIEVGGHFPIKTQDSFNQLTKDEARSILHEAALESSKMEQIISQVKSLLK